MTTVLLVEDSLTDTEIMTRYLRQAGLAVVSVTSCEDAQVKLQAQPPDLVLLDVILPGQSGFELCRQLKTDSSTKRIPVIIVRPKELKQTSFGGQCWVQMRICPNPLIRRS